MRRSWAVAEAKLADLLECNLIELAQLDWVGCAACRRHDTAEFFENEEAATEVCRVCPVWRECLRWAWRETQLPTGETARPAWEAGVYGGLTAGERAGRTLDEALEVAAERRVIY